VARLAIRVAAALLAGAARRTRITAAIDVGLLTIFHAIGARRIHRIRGYRTGLLRSRADTAIAQVSHAIGIDETCVPVLARRARIPTAVDVGLEPVHRAIGASRTHQVDGIARGRELRPARERHRIAIPAGAVRRCVACETFRARRAGVAAAIDAGFGAILDAIGARRVRHIDVRTDLRSWRRAAPRLAVAACAVCGICAGFSEGARPAGIAAAIDVRLEAVLDPVVARGVGDHRRAASAAGAARARARARRSGSSGGGGRRAFSSMPVADPNDLRATGEADQRRVCGNAPQERRRTRISQHTSRYSGRTSGAASAQWLHSAWHCEAAARPFAMFFWMHAWMHCAFCWASGGSPGTPGSPP
jgi:hypothetical protein